MSLHTDVVVLEAFLSRLGRVDGVQPGFTSLPLLLTRGPHTLVLELQHWLQTSFDCHITPHGLEPDDLSLLLGQFATAEKSKSFFLFDTLESSYPDTYMYKLPCVPGGNVCSFRHVLIRRPWSFVGGRGLGGVDLVYKTPHTVTQEGM